MLPLLRQQPACAQDLDYLKNGLCYETRIFPLGQQDEHCHQDFFHSSLHFRF